MPCRSYEDDNGSSEINRLEAENNALTRMLCYMCGKHKPEPDFFDSNSERVSREVVDWWENHQEEDRKKAAKDKAEREKTKELKKALSKLTEREKILLGLVA